MGAKPGYCFKRRPNLKKEFQDGQRVLSASNDNTVKVWDVESGREVSTLAGHSNWVSGVAVSAGVRREVSASDDQTLKVWDVESVSRLASHR